MKYAALLAKLLLSVVFVFLSAACFAAALTISGSPSFWLVQRFVWGVVGLVLFGFLAVSSLMWAFDESDDLK